MQMSTRGLRLGIAISADTVSAVVRGPAAVRVSVPWKLPENADDIGSALTAAFLQVEDQVKAASGRGVVGATVVVGLLPPLVDARLVGLPPLRHSEALSVIRRDAARHFVGAAAPRVIAVRVPGRTAASTTEHPPVLAVSASVPLVEAVRRAAAVHRWHVAAIVPALSAWLSLAGEGRRSTDRALPLALIAAVGDTLHVSRLVSGHLTVLRRVSVDSTDELGSAIGPGPGRALVLAPDAVRQQVTQVLAASGWQALPGPAHATAESAAADFAQPNDLELVPLSLAVERGEQQRTLALRVAVAAALLLLGTGAVELWGVRRELNAVKDQRAELRPKVAPLLVARDSLNALEQRRDVVTGLTTRSPRWTPAIFDLALLLPEETHLTALRATGDTLVIEAVGSSAGEALEALRTAATLRDVKLEGVVDRELEAGATAQERFRIQARTKAAPRAAPPVALPRASDRSADRGTRGDGQ
jgi:Tfp pilus assembly protein PilN